MKKGYKRYVICLVMGSFLQMYGAEKQLSVSSSPSLDTLNLESVHTAEMLHSDIPSAPVHSVKTPLSGIPSPEDALRNTELRAWWYILTTYANLDRATSDPDLKAYYQRIAQALRDLFASSGVSRLTSQEVATDVL